MHTEGGKKLTAQLMQRLKLSSSSSESVVLVLVCALSAAEAASRCSRFRAVFDFCLRNKEGGRNKDKKGKWGEKNPFSASSWCCLINK